MKADKSWDGHSEIPVEPCMVIRDFDVEMPSLNDPDFNTSFDLSKCDKEFTDENKAWEFFKDNPNCRVMDNAGSIYLDVYDE